MPAFTLSPPVEQQGARIGASVAGLNARVDPFLDLRFNPGGRAPSGVNRCREGPLSDTLINCRFPKTGFDLDLGQSHKSETACQLGFGERAAAVLLAEFAAAFTSVFILLWLLLMRGRAFFFLPFLFFFFSIRLVRLAPRTLRFVYRSCYRRHFIFPETPSEID